LNAEDAQVHGVALCGNHPIFCDHAVLLAPGNDLSGEEDEWALGVIHEHKAVYPSTGRRYAMMRAANKSASAAGFGHDDFSRANALVEGDKAAGVVGGRRYDRKNCEISVGNRV